MFCRMSDLPRVYTQTSVIYVSRSCRDDVFIAEMLEIARRIIEAGHWRSVCNSSVEDSATHSICNQLKLPTIKIQMFLKQLYTTTICSLSAIVGVDFLLD